MEHQRTTFEICFDCVKNISLDDFREMKSRLGAAHNIVFQDNADRIDFMEAIRQYDKLEVLEQYLRKFFPVQQVKEEKEDPPRSKFVNRLDEITRITSSPTYYLVNAPAGYGKTRLLLELKRCFKLEQWACAYTLAHETSMMPSIVATWAKDMLIEVEIVDSVSQLGTKFGEAIRPLLCEPKKGENGSDVSLPDSQIDSKPQIKRGLVLLLDMKEPALPLLRVFLEDFIPALFPKIKEFPFRVVIAGRYLAAKEKDFNRKGVSLIPLSLSLFNFANIGQLVDEFSKGQGSTILTAHLTYLTGGHPHCVTDILDLYQHENWQYDRLLAPDKGIVDLINSNLEQIKVGVPSREILQKLLLLSVFRCLDFGLFEQLVKNLPQINLDHDNLLSFLKDLKKNYFFDQQGRWIMNDSMRRILVLEFRQRERDFKKVCRNAQRLYFNHIKSETIDRAGFVVEYLFQCLQYYANDIQKTEQRTRLRANFKVSLLKSLNEYFNFNDYFDVIEAKKDTLVQRIKNDWELQFTINYYLRKDDNIYSSHPCDELITFIEGFQPGEK